VLPTRAFLSAYISQISYFFLKMDEERVTQIGSLHVAGRAPGTTSRIFRREAECHYVKLLTDCRSKEVSSARSQVSLKELARQNDCRLGFFTRRALSAEPAFG